MKKTLYHIGMLAAAALAFVACSKETEINQPKEEVTHVATISLGKADVSTKTEVIEGENSASYKWLEDDDQYLHVYENGAEGEITKFELSGDKTIATLTVSFTGTPTAPYTYTAKYAKNLSGSKNPLVPAEQYPKTDNFDPAADVLVSKASADVTSLAERATEFAFTMGRVVTVNKMTLTGLEEGEVVSSVVFTLDKAFNGYASWDEANSTYKYTNGTKVLMIHYGINADGTTEGATDGTVGEGGTFPVYFTCAPVDAASIESVVVTTDKNVYTKAGKRDEHKTDFTPFYKRFFECIDEIKPKKVFLEVFANNKESFIEEVKHRYPSVRVYELTYYHKKENKCWFIVGESDASAEYPFEGMDEEEGVEWICANVDFECIGDLCMGMGLVGKEAYKNGKKFVGTELNINRLAVLVDKIHTNRLGKC